MKQVLFVSKLAQPDRKQETDVAPYVKQDRTYVPVRFFAEQIGLDVQWDARIKQPFYVRNHM